MTDRPAIPCPHTRPDNHIHDTLAGYVMVVQTCDCGAVRVVYPVDKPPRATEWVGAPERTIRNPVDRVINPPATMEGN